MTARYIELAKALKARLATLLADDSTLVIERRLKPRREREEFVEGKKYVSIFCGAAGHEILGRQVDQEQYEAVIAIQSAAPKPDATAGGNSFGAVTSAAADPVDWGDDVFALAERIKDFWRAETETKAAGVLREEAIAGCLFESLDHDPLYLPIHLEEMGILSVVLQVMFVASDFDFESEEEED